MRRPRQRCGILASLTPVAATGVDVVSVGALTHSVRALDIGFDAAVSPGTPQRRARAVGAAGKRRWAGLKVERPLHLNRGHPAPFFLTGAAYAGGIRHRSGRAKAALARLCVAP